MQFNIMPRITKFASPDSEDLSFKPAVAEGFFVLHATHSVALDLFLTQQLLHSHSSADFLKSSARLG